MASCAVAPHCHGNNSRIYSHPLTNPTDPTGGVNYKCITEEVVLETLLQSVLLKIEGT